MTPALAAPPRPVPHPVAPVAHTAGDDLAGVVTGAFLTSLGIHLLDAAGAVTGGTVGLALLLTHATPLPFAALYGLVTLPFLALAVARFGWAFSARSAAAVALVSALGLLHPHALPVTGLSPTYGALVGNLVVGVGLVVLFRHRTSLGGYNVVALLAQDRLGWRAGWVQLVLDSATIALGLLVAPLGLVLLSVAGAAVLSVVLAMNHRPGRYLA